MLRRFVAALTASVALAAVSLASSSGAAFAASTSYVAGMQQNISDSVVFANFGVGKPVLATGDAQSSAMMVAKSGARDAIAIGWMVNPALNGDSDPHLFVFWWKNGVGQCYNTSCPGYTAYSGATLAVGQKFTAGSPQRFGIQHSGDEWWLWAGTSAGVGSYIGYISDSNFAAAWPTFTTVQFYGAVSADLDYPTSQMGNGYCAEDSNALSIGSVSYTTSSTVNLTPYATYPPAYSVYKLSARTFRYGGSGSCG
jgi:hypothetical protein